MRAKMKSGDVKGAHDFLMKESMEDAPEDVRALKEEDNIIGTCYRKSGVGYLRWCERLEKARRGQGPLYRVCNDKQGTFWLPKYDYLKDVTYAPVEGEEGDTFCGIKTRDIRAALRGLGGGGLIADDDISYVFPYVYLPKSGRRKVHLRHKLAGFFVSQARFNLREENWRIERFQERMERMHRMQRAIGSHMVFACSGWFHLLHDISRGFDFPEEEGDSVHMCNLKRMARNASSERAQELLAHAEIVMTEKERQYDWPDELRKKD